jgi:hypothetical protein
LSDSTAERVIADFGPVEQISAAATSTPVAGRSWVDIWLVVGSIVSLVFYVLPLIALAMLVCTIVRLRRNVGNRALQKAALWLSIASVVLSTGLFISHSVHTLL